MAALGVQGRDIPCSIYKIHKNLFALDEQGRDGLISAAARESLHAGLAQMRHYCHTTGCRRAALLRHFGEAAPAGGCGKCDNCVRKQEGDVAERDFGDAARQLLEVMPGK